MTSPANQQNPQATNTSATTGFSYASAAGAPQKSAQNQSPVVAADTQAPVVVDSSASPAQNAKPVSPAPVNGKTAAPPNGAHSRHSSVTMAANGPNSYAANGGHAAAAKSGIQFGFGSPSVAQSSPQASNSAPIPIPGGNNPRVASPAHSPSPIPQPSASGGRPPSGLQQPGNQMTFGSLGSDGEVCSPSACVTNLTNMSSQRHMRQGSVPGNQNAMGPGQPGSHFRRESTHSAHSEGPGGPNRNNFQQGGRGRGGFNPHNNYNHNQMGYPPNNQFRNGPNQGRSMPPPFQPQGPRNMAYPNSPQPNHRSPAMVNAMPGTPTMPPNQPMPMNQGQYHYGPQQMPGGQQQVQLPSSFPQKSFSKHPKNKAKLRRENDRSFQPHGRVDVAMHGNNNYYFNGGRARRFSKRSDRDHQWSEMNMHHASATPWSSWEKSPANQILYPPPIIADSSTCTTSHPLNTHPLPQSTSSTSHSTQPAPELNLAPTTGNFERMVLTMRNQNYGGGFPPQVDGYGRPLSYPMQPYMGGAPPQTHSPGYNQAFVPPQHYHHHQSHSMSRTPSQPERPGSANQQGPPVAMGSNTPGSTPGQVKSDIFSKPGRKSAAIPIKTSTGQVVDTSTFKVAPSSPAPSSQQAKTPPVASSNPTPSPKPATPAHTRTDSQAARSASEIQEELKAKIAKATAMANAESAEPEAKPEAKAETESKPEPVQPAEKPAAEAPEPKKEEEKKPEPAKQPEKKEKTQAEKDAELEAMIAEMEAADREREEKEKAHQEKVNAEKEAAKKKAEEDRKANAADADAKLREQEREMERLEEEKEKKRAEAEASGKTTSVADLLSGKAEAPKVESVTDKLAGMKIADKPAGDGKPTTAEKRGAKPAALNLAPLNTKPVEPPQPSAALQSLKSARFLQVMDQDIYPEGIKSPNPATNVAVAKKGKTFKYDANFLMQFRGVFTEQPSVEFHQQVKSLIGDGPQSARSAQTPGSRQGSRGGSGAFQMGAFNAPPGGRTLPSGTSSEQRFAMSNNMSSRPHAPAMNSFNRPGGAFPMGAGMSRTSSQSNMGPNSPRQGSRSTRGSRRNDHGAKEAQAAKTMPLTAGQELKPIETTSTGWKPTSVGRNAGAAAAGAGDHLDPPMVQRKVKAALNKMTPENFERIAESILKIASQSKDETDGRTLRQVIQLTFEKATDEAHWAGMYARFCKKMLDSMSPDIKDERVKDRSGNVVSGGNLFRKYLLNRCQEDFERGWKTDIGEAPKEGEEGTKKSGEAEMLSDEYYKAAAAKRRGLGLVQLIGELYKLGMLTERIMVECIHKLVDSNGPPDEAEIESLCKLLRTIGQHLDMSEKGRPMMDVYFERIQKTINSPELPSRLKFMLMDVVDLRKANWASKEKDKGPKTLEEVRAEVSYH